MVFDELIVVELAVVAVVPAAKIGPTELFGLTPPTADIALPVVGTGGAVI